MKLNNIKQGDEFLNETCAICLENYQVNEVLRELPCGHYFHQKDIDVWLIKNRNCPMCKIDILQACGIEVNFYNMLNYKAKLLINKYFSFIFKIRSISQKASCAGK
mgnify:CR=1 FL=1